MTLEEMRRHEWVVSWSGGKDSTATIILMHEHGIPIKEIVYVRMMYDETLPATLPIMTDFVDHAKEVFESWGYKVSIVPSYRTLKELSERRYKRSKDERRIGCQYGITACTRGICNMTFVKTETIRHITDKHSLDYHMVGYASDETTRLHRLNDTHVSILVELGIKESDTFEICRKYDLLSPLYAEGVTRDGCWFCPNANKKERKKLNKEYPDLVRKIYDLIEMSDFMMNEKTLENYSKRNNWIKDYILLKKSTEDQH